jgi:hypothetical protein
LAFPSVTAHFPELHHCYSTTIRRERLGSAFLSRERLSMLRCHSWCRHDGTGVVP